ncbi:iron-sulfur cluster carrier protein ApbC [Larsenimonas rhizosphaerae]|uniref:Iron-sulfur cluster carrier protein n=1 Tax=Larsenimonas rhizosphaerae TaxID=2944682 RepID=A0AA41ZG21_9GAMM|nr:iron-sulfur cluster carrier protein ApbC [Larsenimonas rhizosphaerae]MCM2130529.1 iron-sulfur cluster carrier protein ApbC [Larsenimonas rhizosphaerae]MCX2523233.1 iron-sulfur cluster carrier protein ApbC [Larsenimonas rhizosphaerae]
MTGTITHIVAVASGKGGVGKSTVTANLALAMAARGKRVGVLDADIYGPSQAQMMGIAPGTRPKIVDEKTMLPLEAHGMKIMSMAFLTDIETAMAWRGPMVSGAFQQLLDQTRWGELDYLFIDMPPGTGDIQLTLAQKVPVAGAVIVTTPQDIALLDARRGIEMFRKVKVPVLGVIENMSTHVCSQCGHEEAVFGDGGGERIAAQYDTRLLGQLPLTMSIREQVDGGRPTVVAAPDSDIATTFARMAGEVDESLGARVASTGPSISFE